VRTVIAAESQSGIPSATRSTVISNKQFTMHLLTSTMTRASKLFRSYSHENETSLCDAAPNGLTCSVIRSLNTDRTITRRQFVRAASLAAGFFVVPGAFAEELMRAALKRTAWVTEGPFYPEKLPLDTDNDLIIVNDSITPAIGEITHVGGRILDARGDPIKNAVVEIWQVDHNAIYLAERGSKRTGFDANFQGFGRFQTGSSGEYRFRTIKPVPYPGRLAPHIHFKIKMPGRDPWTTQLYIKGYPSNQRDGIYREIGDAKARESVTVDFTPIENSRIGELAAKFDIVLGFTPGG
jgi:protocatechuate 3,4-dioxygenase beta subunit